MRRWNAAVAALFLGFAVATVASPLRAEEPLSACSAAVGTYLVTNTLSRADGSGLTSRSLITLTGDGLALRSDSDQQAGENGLAFGDSQGAWRCTGASGGRLSLSATLLNFTYPAPGQSKTQIGRIDYLGSVDPVDGALRLDAKLFFLPLGADASGAAPADAIAIAIEGKRIEAP